jgi:outer membrane lipoprotein-sorting protein
LQQLFNHPPIPNDSHYKKNITVKIGNQELKIEARRQGSVYVYDKSVSPAIFYQLDKWHQYQHPSRWRNEWINEAEVLDNSSIASNQLIKTEYANNIESTDFTNSISYIELNNNQWVEYAVNKKDLTTVNGKIVIHLLIKNNQATSIELSGISAQPMKLETKSNSDWKWIKQVIEIDPKK